MSPSRYHLSPCEASRPRPRCSLGSRRGRAFVRVLLAGLLTLLLVAVPTAIAVADAPTEPPSSFVDTAPRLGQAPTDERPPVIYSSPPKKKTKVENWLYAAGFICLIAAFYFTTRGNRGASGNSDKGDDDDRGNNKDIV